MKIIFTLSLIFFYNTSYCTQLPKEIIGTWQINIEKTFELFKKQPGFKEFPKEKMGEFKKQLSQM